MAIMNLFSGMIRSILAVPSDDSRVCEVRVDLYRHWQVCQREECLRLLAAPPPSHPPQPSASHYHLVLLLADGLRAERAFLLWRCDQLPPAEALFERLVATLLPLVACWPRDTVQLPVLQRVCDGVRANPHWRLGHVAADLGWVQPFEQLQQLCDDLHSSPSLSPGLATPLHVAVGGGHVRLVRHLLRTAGASVVARDSAGNTPLHLAAADGNCELVAMLIDACGDSGALNARNSDHMTPLLTACRHDRPKIVQQLVLAGADCNAPVRDNDDEGKHPSSTASTSSSPSTSPASTAAVTGDTSGVCSARKAFEAFPLQVSYSEISDGGGPLHWARGDDIMRYLLDLGLDTESRNFSGERPLHVVARAGRLCNALLLLAHGAAVDAPDDAGNTPLLVAVERGDVDMARACLVFGARLAHVNAAGTTALHLAATHLPAAAAAATAAEKVPSMVEMLLAVGAPRCTPPTAQCNHHCAGGQSNSGATHCDIGDSVSDDVIGVGTAQKRARHDLDRMLTLLTMSGATAATEWRSGGEKRSSTAATAATADTDGGGSGGGVGGDADGDKRRCRVLCLDGGGVKGLILIQQLLALEPLLLLPHGQSSSATDNDSTTSSSSGRQPQLLDSFDWVSGTSIGGVLALALARGHSLRACQRLLFRMKERVFSGQRPYNDSALETLLQQVFGTTATMADIERPQLLVTAVLADRHPADLHLFRNYPSPHSLLDTGDQSEPQTGDERAEQLLWRVARATTAAPTYFKPTGRFIDGGLIANNPTLDTLTEIYEYQVAQRALNITRDIHPPSAVLSLGCGRPPVVKVDCMDIGMVRSFTTFFSVAGSLFKLVTDQATSVDNRVVDRARAWCGSLGVPYLRCSPQLSEDLPLDAADDDRQLLLALWQTMAQMHAQHHQLALFARLLTR